jgi:hypothetical protein
MAARSLACGWLAWSCAGASPPSRAARADRAPADAPLVAAQPGAWFDAYGNLTVVGAGRRLRLVLSAPISACAIAFQTGGAAADLSMRASLPFHVLGEVCRATHPAILLPEESETASPSELEHSYHEVARCAAADWGLTEGWIPKVIEDSDPCPLALGVGWRLPTQAELQGLTIDDRKAVAGALYDADGPAESSELLLYARAPSSRLTLVTLSPNAAEQAPVLTDEKRTRPFFGATLRCVQSGGSTPRARATPPGLPHAVQCLREQHAAQGVRVVPRGSAPPPELQKLNGWVDGALASPKRVHDEKELVELAKLLASPTLERIAHEAREERALTERYAELAESLDDPSVSAAERERRHAEFAHLRKRLGGQIVQSAEASGTDRTALAAVLSRLKIVLESAATQTGSPKKGRAPDYRPLLARVRQLGGEKAAGP